MSLNGLDTAKVNKAHESAIAETGGWFLLNYTTRAEVDVFKTGNGGFVETRDAIAQYEEKSPLYGLLVYRRKKVLLKYVPDGTSRLLQARLSVHLQSIIEKFPHDALLAITSSSEINETSLSSSVSALQTSGSTKSLDSVKSRHRLTEITEDASENPAPNHPKTSEKPIREEGFSDSPGVAGLKTRHDEKEVLSDNALLSQVRTTTKDREYHTGNMLPRSPTGDVIGATQKPKQEAETQVGASLEGRQSSQAARQLGKETYSSYKYKPKVKLGPRPSIDNEQTRNSGSFARPTSTLPTGIRMPSRHTQQIERPRTHQVPAKSFFSGAGRFPLPPAAASIVNGGQSNRPPSRAGSAATVPAYAYYPGSASPSTPPSIAPEKQRLMKALQQRKKNKMAKMVPERPPAQPDTQVHDGPNAVEPQAQNRLGHGNDDSKPDNVVALAKDSTEVLPTGTETEPSKVDSGPELAGKAEVSVEDEVQESQGGQERRMHEAFGPPPQNGTDPERVTPITNTDIETDKACFENDSELAPNIPAPAEPSSLQVDFANSESHHTVNAMTAKSPQASMKSLSPQNVPLPPQDEGEYESLQLWMPSRSDPKSNSLHDDLASPDEPSSFKGNGASSGKTPFTRESSKKKDTIMPIKVGDISDATSLSGDSFLEELQSATVEEARPVLVSKSPATPFFPGSPRSVRSKSSDALTVQGPRSDAELGDQEVPPVPATSHSELSRLTSSADRSNPLSFITPTCSTSNPLDSIPTHQEKKSPTKLLSSRESSISPMQMTRFGDTDGSAPKKSTVSSLISQRIKALEKFSSSTSPPNSTTAVVTPSLVSKRRTSLATPPASAGIDTSRQPKSPGISPCPTPSPSPHTNTVSRRFLPSRSQSSEGNLKQDSVSVTATIIRNASDPSPEQLDYISETRSVNLRLSPLTIQHKPSSFFSKSSRKASRSKSSSTSSLSSPRETAASPKRNSIPSHHSISSRKSSLDTVRPLSPPSSDGTASIDGEKKESKKRGFLKRMSAISFSRRSIGQALNQSLNDQPIIEHQEPEVDKGRSSVIIGELNVQFPDTLLWKRRYLELDKQGYLVLAPSKLDKGSKVGTKRFHITDFKLPYTPEPDREELPNSVILDFNDSSTLQCACETRNAQLGVLHALQSAHKTFSTA